MSKLSSECQRITHTGYNWTGFNNPIGYTAPRSNWAMSKKRQRKFLKINYRFKNDGTKIKIIGG